MTGIMGLAGKIQVFMAAVLMACTVANAQTDRREVRKGNRDFKKEEYKEAEIDYRKALVKDSTSLAAVYNLGNTLYRNGDMEQAVSTYGKLKDAAAASEYGASYYYNMGNAAASMEDWQSAVDAYAKSLLMNPGDMDAKENYVYAKSKLKNQQNGGGGNDDKQDRNDKNDQNQDRNENQDQNGQNNDENQNDNQNNNQDDQQDRNDSQDQSGTGQQPQITPQAAQQMLQAIQAKEKETQEKVNKEKAALLKSRQKEKNW